MVLWIVVAFLVGNVTGCFFGMGSTKLGKELLEGMLATEQPADVQRPRKLERPGFSLRYPRNWMIDVEDEDYDPDHLFMINSPGSCYTMFTLYDVGSDSKKSVKEQLEHFSKLVSSPQTTKFEKWGNYSGHGSDLRGRLMGLRAGFKIFAHSSETRSFVVVNLCFDGDREFVGPGFDLIERTFALK